jgi:hypothetical protein
VGLTDGGKRKWSKNLETIYVKNLLHRFLVTMKIPTMLCIQLYDMCRVQQYIVCGMTSDGKLTL